MTDKALRLRGKLISEDEYGNISLTDIWTAAGRPKNQNPAQWMTHDQSKRFIIAAYDKIVAQNHNKEKPPFNTVCYAKRGRNGVSFAHPLIAAKYAGYLNPKLEIQIVEVWMRYRAGDPRLADEILERASAEANEWAAKRALSRATRKLFTDMLQSHGVSEMGFGLATNAIYRGLYGRKAKQLLRDKDLPSKANLRDHFSPLELSSVTLSEALAADRIDDENSFGNQECADASNKSANFIREALERDRADRQRKRLV